MLGEESAASRVMLLLTPTHSPTLTPCREDNSCFADSEFENEIF